MYFETLGQFKKQLGQISSWIDLAIAHAREEGVDADSFLELRLAPDQFPLARQIQIYYGNFDDLLDTQTQVFRQFRNDGAHDQYALGVSVFDQRPAGEIVALARENPGFTAYLRSQREWAILHYNLLRNVSAETTALLAAIEKELAAP